MAFLLPDPAAPVGLNGESEEMYLLMVLGRVSGNQMIILLKMFILGAKPGV